jgi:hypothetical protein
MSGANCSQCAAGCRGNTFIRNTGYAIGETIKLSSFVEAAILDRQGLRV